MKRLLLITYYWPPAGGPGVQRWVKMSKYLARMGYQLHVLTVEEASASYPTLDASVGKEIELSIKITRTKSFEALKIFSSLFKKEKVIYAGIPDKNKMSLPAKIALYIRSNFFIPDARIGWNRYAIKAAKEIIITEKTNVVITTGPPHSTHLIGLSLKKKFPGIKWITDLRDPWTDIYYYGKLSHTAASKAKDSALETEVLKKADAVTVTSQPVKELFARKLPDAESGKIHIIPNGFDEDDIKTVEIKATDKFIIFFAGTIIKELALEGFVKAVKELIALNKKILVHFAGNVDESIKFLLKAELPANHLVESYVPHKKILEYMAQANVLMLSIPAGNNPGIAPGKMFEYLAMRKPVLCLGPKGDTADKILTECEAGKTFAHNDVEGMKEYLQAVSEGKIMQPSEEYRKYSRKQLAGKFAEVIENLI